MDDEDRASDGMRGTYRLLFEQVSLLRRTVGNRSATYAHQCCSWLLRQKMSMYILHFQFKVPDHTLTLRLADNAERAL